MPTNVKRARLALTIAIVLLLGLVFGMLFILARMLTPEAAPKQAPANALIWVRSLYGYGPTAEQQLLSPSSVAIGPDGRIYATDPIRARVLEFKPDGSFFRILQTSSPTQTPGPGQFVRPESIATDRAGNLYIADSQAKKIIVFDSADRFVREWPVDQQARGVSVSAGKAYVLDVGHVIVFDTTGKRLSSFASRGPAAGQIDAYQGIVARSGVIYIADSYNRRIEAFDERGRLKWVLPTGIASRKGPAADVQSGASDGSGDAHAASHLWQLPQDLTFDGAGRLVVVDAFAFELAVVDPATGRVEATYGSYGRADGQFYYPTSIAYDAERDWFAVADTQNNRVQIVRIPGSGNAFAADLWRATSSPYRYLAVPVVLLMATLLMAVVLSRRLMARRRAADTGIEDVAVNGEMMEDERL